MSLYRLIVLLGITSTVNATPLLSINVCPLVTDVIGALRDYPPASTFCSSFIGIETLTMYDPCFEERSSYNTDGSSTATSTITPADVVVTSSVTDTASPVSTTSTISSIAVSVQSLQPYHFTIG